MSTRETCEFCNSTFINKIVLKTHINTNKRCLSSRGMKLTTKNVCEGCNTIFVSPNHLTTHYEICKDYKIVNIVKKHKEELKEKEEHYKEELKEELKIKEEKYNEALKKERQHGEEKRELLDLKYKCELAEKDKKYEMLQLSYEHLQYNYNELKVDFKLKYNELKEEHQIKTNKYEAVLERLATDAVNKPNTTNNTVNNNVIRDHLSTQYTIDGLSDKQLEQRIRLCMTEEVFWEGQKGLAKMCVESIIKTPDNKMMICCTDTSRGKFKLFDVKGNLKEDIDARLFTDRVSKFIKIVGNEIREAIQESIDNKSSMLEEKNGREKDQLLKKMEQLGYSLFDVFNVDDHERNKVFRNELAILSSINRTEDI